MKKGRADTRQLWLFVAGIVCMGMAGGVFESTFNNYVNDTFEIGAAVRGMLEFPRELPGFLTALFAGALFFLAETRIAAACAALVAVGMVGLAVHGDAWNPMLVFMVIWSIGVHLMMPVQSSLGLALAEKGEGGKRLGQLSGARTAAGLLGCVAVVVALRWLKLSYTVTFIAGAAAACVAVIAFLAMRMPDAHLKRPRFVWRKEYWVFYVLALLFGARKQLFITFGPWVLIKLFDQKAYVFAELWITASVIGIFFQPLLGRLIDRLGERTILLVDAVLVLTICIGYAVCSFLPGQRYALAVLCLCYVVDLLLFGANMARSTYLSKIALRREDIAPTLSLGITINHAVSMTIPVLGGWVWLAYGPAWVFAGAGGIAILMFVFAAQVRVPERQRPA